VTTNGREKPGCEECGHSISFHGSGKTYCGALGCVCNAYVGLSYLGAASISLESAARILDMSPGTLRNRAADYGGVKVKNTDLFIGYKPRGRTKEVWRFHPQALARVMAGRKIRKAESLERLIA
jgi:hypothetical protein